MPPRALCSARRSCGGVRSWLLLSPDSRWSARPRWAIDTASPLSCVGRAGMALVPVNRGHATLRETARCRDDSQPIHRHGMLGGGPSARCSSASLHHRESRWLPTTRPVDNAGDKLRETPGGMCTTCGENCGQAKNLAGYSGSDQGFICPHPVCRNFSQAGVEPCFPGAPPCVQNWGELAGFDPLTGVAADRSPPLHYLLSCAPTWLRPPEG
jgi:hypothetical protein